MAAYESKEAGDSLNGILDLWSENFTNIDAAITLGKSKYE